MIDTKIIVNARDRIFVLSYLVVVNKNVIVKKHSSHCEQPQ